MNDLNKRFVLFLLLCIPIRVYLAYFAKVLSKQSVYYMGLLMTIPAVVMMYLYLTKQRQTGAETFGAPIWWNYLRPIHAILLLSFSFMALSKYSYSYIPLVVDVIVGFSFFMINHFS